MSDSAAQSLRSAVFECTVRHERFVPRAHAFTYRLFYLALDLDEVPRLGAALRFLGVNRPGFLSWWERDFLPLHERMHGSDGGVRPAPAASGLKACVLAWCAAQGFDAGDAARVVLVTMPRMLGYQFNPVSFYFVSASDGRPVAAVAEVTNTFREVKLYVVPPVGRAGGEGVFRLRTPKHFYVSPFSSVDVAFDFTLRTPGDRLAVRIDDFDSGRRTLHSVLVGERRPLTDLRLAGLWARHPLLTLRVITLIHWQALRLWLKRVPFFRKADAAGRQRNLFRPHPSLQPTP